MYVWIIGIVFGVVQVESLMVKEIALRPVSKALGVQEKHALTESDHCPVYETEDPGADNALLEDITILAFGVVVFELMQKVNGFPPQFSILFPTQLPPVILDVSNLKLGIDMELIQFLTITWISLIIEPISTPFLYSLTRAVRAATCWFVAVKDIWPLVGLKVKELLQSKGLVVRL